MIVFSDRSVSLALRANDTVDGQVESAAPDNGCGNGGHEVVYSFRTAAGVTYRGSESTRPNGPYGTLQPGDSVPIIYVASDPTLNAIATQQTASLTNVMPIMLFPIFGLAFFLPFLWPRWSQLRRDRRLFRTGSLAPGRVGYVSTTQGAVWPGWPKPSSAEVFVAARLRSGEEREVKATCSNDWLLAHLPPGADVHVCVEGDRAVLLENYLR
jgi:hypothetical protein